MSVYVVCWIACFETKYKTKAILAYVADPETLLPKVWKNREDLPSPRFLLFGTN